MKVEVGRRLNFDLLFLGLPQPASPLVDLTTSKIIRRSYEPSGRAKGWGWEFTVLFASPSTSAVAGPVCLSGGGGCVCPSGLVCMPRLVRRSWRRVTVLTSCFFSSSSAETCSLSRPSDWPNTSTRLSRLQMRACDTWVRESDG